MDKKTRFVRFTPWSKVRRPPKSKLSEIGGERPWWGTVDWFEWTFYKLGRRRFAKVTNTLTPADAEGRAKEMTYVERAAGLAELGIRPGEVVWYEIEEE